MVVQVNVVLMPEAEEMFRKNQQRFEQKLMDDLYKINFHDTKMVSSAETLLYTHPDGWDNIDFQPTLYTRK